MESILYTTQTVEFDWYSNRVRRNSSLKVFLTWSGLLVALLLVSQCDLLPINRFLFDYYKGQLLYWPQLVSFCLSDSQWEKFTVVSRNSQLNSRNDDYTTSLQEKARKQAASRLFFFLSFFWLFFFLPFYDAKVGRQRERQGAYWTEEKQAPTAIYHRPPPGVKFPIL